MEITSINLNITDHGNKLNNINKNNLGNKIE